MSKLYLISFFLVTIASAQSKKPEYAASLIPETLKENANAVIRYSQTDIDIPSRRSISVKTLRVVTILNEYGLSSMDAAEVRHIFSIDATIYDAAGNLIKNIKRKDFKDFSLSEGYEITDDRVVALSYTPVQYPFTIVYESEIGDSNTAFIPDWAPTRGVFTSVEKSVVNIKCETGLGLKFKEISLGSLDVKKDTNPNGVSFTAQNISAFRLEAFSPSSKRILPRVIFGIDKFHLEGVDGDATSWESFGTWMHTNLLTGRDEISDQTKAKVNALVAGETDPIRKAKIIYKYVQDKTRYVSIQLGIGGWKPMKANDVDRLGYGDCKALTNYTRALLSAVNVPSYYTVVYAGERLDLDPDFVSVQGNHVILAVPDKSGMLWLECTSQTSPFGYQGGSTSNRLALIVKPSGGALTRTTVRQAADNTQQLSANVVLLPNGNLEANVDILSRGLQYENRAHFLEKSSDEKISAYKEFLGINNVKLANIKVNADMDKAELRENMSVEAEQFANNAANRLIFPVNAFNKFTKVPQRYRTRNTPFEVNTAFLDSDQVTIEIPEGFSIETKPENLSFKDKFGEYSAEFIAVGPQKMLYKRTFTLHEGSYEKADYETFRKFCEQVAKADNSKMILIKT